MISVIIPVSTYETSCEVMESLFLARDRCSERTEIIIVINPPEIGRVVAKNVGATIARGDTLLFLDCDLVVSQSILNEVSKKSSNIWFVGGGVKYVRPSRYSLGILCSFIPLAFYLLWKQVTVGAFWVKKDAFNAIHGFREKKYDDIDFAVRLKQYADSTGLKFESLKDSHIVWSTRKYDMHGDWHWLGGYRCDQGHA